MALQKLAGKGHMHRGTLKPIGKGWDLGDSPVQREWGLLRPGEAEKDWNSRGGWD